MVIVTGLLLLTHDFKIDIPVLKDAVVDSVVSILRFKQLKQGSESELSNHQCYLNPQIYWLSDKHGLHETLPYNCKFYLLKITKLKL